MEKETVQQESSLSIVLFGNTSAVYFGPENILLGQDQPTVENTEFSQIVPISRLVSGRNVSVINLLGLEETEFSPQSVYQFTSRLVKEKEIHAFIFVLQLNYLTDTDKLGLEWLKRTFGEAALSFVMILFTYEREEECDTIIDDLKKNTALEQLTRQCGDRYWTCSKSMNNQSEMRTLLKKIEHLVSENNQCFYTAEIYNTAFRDLQDGQSQKKACDRFLPQEKVDIKEDLAKQPRVKTSELNAVESRSDFPEELKELFSRVLGNHHQIIKPADVLQIIKPLLLNQKASLHLAFLQKLLMMNYKARYVSDIVPEPEDDDQSDIMTTFDPVNNEQIVDPMDVQMAVFHCSDPFLKLLIVNKLCQCQYALPLLVPNPFTREIEFPLWGFRQIIKSWKTIDSSGNVITKSMPISMAETPMVAFFRFGSVSSSKSKLMNNLINEKHDIFFHRDCPGSSRNRLLMDGVVEIAWYCPSDKKDDYFTDCIAFCNLHGDAESNEEQLRILTEMSSVNVVLLSEKKDAENNTILKTPSIIQKPLICLFTNSNSGVQSKNLNLKFTVGIKQRSQSELSKVLKIQLKKCLPSAPKFRLENVGASMKIRTDEKDNKCQKGKEVAFQMTKIFHGMELSKIKEKCLPCQGTLWLDWCKKNKEFHRLQGTDIERKRCEKQTEMRMIREQQHMCGVTSLMQLFIHTLSSSEGSDKDYFLKWLEILLDNYTTDDGHRDLQHQEISELKAAPFGLEHILREMSQIYESFISIQTHKNTSLREDLSCLPKLGAEIMLSGYPLEIMDGDAAHVPLIWVSAVLDELVKILGDSRVFVLSVLGIQSSGKSTMLNAMFGLQFAVSAGRCTKGAFMQLVRVSEEMKDELKFDYILVVDTEGLRALEHAEKTTIPHDNELATFVVGLGNLTLINIFGENPAEMQDILQIVVQAFLRMKKVRLNPRCMFVHQNVGDLTAGEKTMKGRRSLQEKLDKMTRLASNEEDIDAQCFSDIIAFDVQRDVRYFAQLWEGSPPMAPPNPSYSENIDELKTNIFLNMTNHLMSLSQFKSHLSNLWNALLNENFVFSFKNTLEIAVYRKLENEYCKWTWRLRSAMLSIENKLLNRVNNERYPKIDEKDIMSDMKDTKLDVEKSIQKFFDEDEDKETLSQWRKRFERKMSDLNSDLVQGTKKKLDKVACLKIARDKIDQEKTVRENKLYKQSKDLAIILKSKEANDDTLKAEFEVVWDKWVTELTQDVPSVDKIDIWEDVTQTLSENYEVSLVCERQSKAAYKRFESLGDCSDYIILNKQQEPHQEDLQSEEHVEEDDESPGVHTVRDSPSEVNCRTIMLTSEDNKLFRALIGKMIKDTEEEIQRKPIAEQGYSQSYIPEIIASVKKQVELHQTLISKYKLKKEFTVDLCLHVCSFAAKHLNELYNTFKEANDVEFYLKKQKSQYFNIFKNYYNGATSAAVFGEFIVDKLKPSILQAAYDQTAIDVAEKMKRDIPAFSGNRSNLEKHILTSLAEEENFENYTEYFNKPKDHFNHFITKEVNKYLLEDKCQEVLEIIKTNLKSKGRCVMDAVSKATEDVRKRNGNIDMWLEYLSKELKDELQFKEESCLEQREITDFGFLQEIVNKGLTDTMAKLCCELKTISDLKQEMFKKKPHKVLTEHLCRCCWVQCPFCNAICTNTMEDHDGDHRVRFHRNCGISGWSFMYSENLGVDFCTTAVSSNEIFFRTSAGVFTFKEYRKAGGEYARWNISPDTSEMPYWKWFVCRFQEDLEKHYKRKFTGNGEIPQEWRNITKNRAIESLSEL